MSEDKMSEDKHDPVKQTYLLTCQCIRTGSNTSTMLYQFTQDIEGFIEQTQQYYSDSNQYEQYFIINTLKVSEAFYQKWDGWLVGL